MSKVKSSTERIIDRIINHSKKKEITEALELFRELGYARSSSGRGRQTTVLQKTVYASIVDKGLHKYIDDSIMRSIHILSR